ncbi:hypothetical protein JR316_0009881 [Psilocybe cubensis]|uniref:Uncharacterized protein n=2 Tax=Psilocybe cubensis TaxID=181762 RepID=A0ACB8GPJ9_PSICU|nr:hypothetical protein JR316_0009881 [Psilocybe cubensis]KAH9477655.1 hypothetical protein JR316_0009881 [Psilocybe cubensis]
MRRKPSSQAVSSLETIFLQEEGDIALAEEELRTARLKYERVFDESFTVPDVLRHVYPSLTLAELQVRGSMEQIEEAKYEYDDNNNNSVTASSSPALEYCSLSSVPSTPVCNNHSAYIQAAQSTPCPSASGKGKAQCSKPHLQLGSPFKSPPPSGQPPSYSLFPISTSLTPQTPKKSVHVKALSYTPLSSTQPSQSSSTLCYDAQILRTPFTAMSSTPSLQTLLEWAPVSTKLNVPHYTVRVRRRVGFYSSWNLASSLIEGIENKCSWKGFSNYDEAAEDYFRSRTLSLVRVHREPYDDDTIFGPREFAENILARGSKGQAK